MKAEQPEPKPMQSLVNRFHLLLLTVTVAITGVALYRIQPDFAFPAHWSGYAGPDWLWPRNVALAVGPALGALLLMVFFIIGARMDKAQLAKYRHILDPALSLMLSVIAAVQLGLLLTGIGSDLDFIRITAFGLGVVLLVLGIVLSEAERHTYAGLRMPWPIASDRAWRLVHRLTGAAFAIGGAGLLALAWFMPDPGPLVIGLAIALLVPPVIAGLSTAATRSL
ncbi:hypothetical protein VW29_07385 [Devosia limi DSM 17137]|uniref:SdpI/YhfL protein family protein n=2 Tax=Devosia limi DSM 17137 TaxID=1121477 RepID=A0A0F5LU27_9HYPH|nr:SdpI family protein [Devosia limi]KKB85152.1 hypothetical protein VW29_07385 [Devosia limi DSM 17137]